MRRRGWIALAIIVLVPIALPLLFIEFLLLRLEAAEARVHQSLNVYQRATFLYEDAKYIGANTAEKGLYYWTESPTDEVEKYYEQYFPSFVASSDEYGKWLITASNVEGSPITPVESSAYLQLGAFCNSQRHYECVSVALVDASQPDLYRLAITSVGMFRHDTPPPGLTSIPANGTLIIYNYWIEDF